MNHNKDIIIISTHIVYSSFLFILDICNITLYIQLSIHILKMNLYDKNIFMSLKILKNIGSAFRVLHYVDIQLVA